MKAFSLFDKGGYGTNSILTSNLFIRQLVCLKERKHVISLTSDIIPHAQRSYLTGRQSVRYITLCDFKGTFFIKTAPVPLVRLLATKVFAPLPQGEFIRHYMEATCTPCILPSGCSVDVD